VIPEKGLPFVEQLLNTKATLVVSTYFHYFFGSNISHQSNQSVTHMLFLVEEKPLT
jgi:hypothetical protein